MKHLVNVFHCRYLNPLARASLDEKSDEWTIAADAVTVAAAAATVTKVCLHFTMIAALLLVVRNVVCLVNCSSRFGWLSVVSPKRQPFVCVIQSASAASFTASVPFVAESKSSEIEKALGRISLKVLAVPCI